MSKLEFLEKTHFDELESPSMSIKFWSSDRIQKSQVVLRQDYETLSDICRLNALAMVSFAGSGHIGTSFSAAEIMTLIKAVSLREHLNLGEFINCQFFSSKGHDAPMLYAVLHAFGQLTDEQIFKFRRANGLEGHPTTKTPGVITNTGSLGMGISKAKGFIYGNRLLKINRKVVVLLGDGELQEGQIWESMPGAARDLLHELVVIVDANKIQSDTWVSETLDLGSVKDRVVSFGWQFLECPGNSVPQLNATLAKSSTIGKPTWIHAHTLKGAGVSFMENFDVNGKFYKFHSGPPTPLEYSIASQEILERITSKLGINFTRINNTESEFKAEDKFPKVRTNSIVDTYADCLVDLVAKKTGVFILDADLSFDTGTYKARELYPSRYLQCGIAEQDMVSIAGALALNSFIPIVHSFANFLTMRACEQVFNNATENTAVIYVGFLAGLLPGMPGISHQAVTDMGLMSLNPNMRIFEPADKREIELSLSRATEEFRPSYIRMQSVGTTQFEAFRRLDLGTIWNLGDNAIIVCSGISMLEQAQLSIELLQHSGLNVSLLTLFDTQNLMNSEAFDFISRHNLVIVIENYLPGNLLYKMITDSVRKNGVLNKRVYRLGLNSLPICGQNSEVLEFHGLNAETITEFVSLKLANK